MKISQRYKFVETVIIIWILSFPMMWIVLYNLQVMPMSLLIFAVPLTIIEVVIAQWLIKK